MAQIELNGTSYQVDNDGYLLNLDDWSETFATLMAERDGIGKLFS